MLSDIPNAWPPAPGQGQPQTGWKMSTRRPNDGPWRETLLGLHEPAWWTGVRLSGSGQFRVRLQKAGGGPAFPEAADECYWVQSGGTWHPFPWVIPAAMATHMQMTVEVEPLDPLVDSTVVMHVAFHELPQLQPRDRYLFVHRDGLSIQVWNGRQRTWGCPTEGDEPVWNTLHLLVPPAARLLSNPHWIDRVFCIHAWDEPCPLD